MTGAITFLRSWYGELPPQLTAITPEGSIRQQRDRSWDDAAKFFIRYDGIANLYYSVNAVTTTKIGKASKADITHAIGCHVDVDYRVDEPPAEGRERILNLLRGYRLPPTVIIFSGGGFNALWRFKEPLALDSDDDREQVEAANRALEYALTGDKCHNIDRILRQPYTWNLPTAKKAAKGRVKAWAEIAGQDWSRLYTLDDFDKALPRATVKRIDAAGNPVAPVEIKPVSPRSWADLGIPDHVRLQQVILHGQEMLGGKPFPSRSEAVFYAVNELIRCGVSDDKIVGTLLHPRLRISESIRDKANPAVYAARQVTRARLLEERSEYRVDPEAEDAYEQL